MNSGKAGAAGRQLEALWISGTLTGLSDSQLLSRYVDTRGRDAVAEAAFRELVNRHGPMVLAVCRQLLRHPHDADDAFQATFLVLVRKARSIRVGESLAPWLSSVAYRTARRAREIAARYRPLDTVPIDAARSIFPGRGLSLRPPALAARGAGPPPGQAPGSHRALPPRGQVARRGGAPAALAGRHGEQPPLPRSTAPTFAAGTSRPGALVGDALGQLAGWDPSRLGAASDRIHDRRRDRVRYRPNRACAGPVLNPRSPENHVPQKAQNDLARRPGDRCDRKLRRVGALALSRIEAVHPEPRGGAGSLRTKVERPPERPDRHSRHRVRRPRRTMSASPIAPPVTTTASHPIAPCPWLRTPSREWSVTSTRRGLPDSSMSAGDRPGSTARISRTQRLTGHRTGEIGRKFNTIRPQTENPARGVGLPRGQFGAAFVAPIHPRSSIDRIVKGARALRASRNDSLLDTRLQSRDRRSAGIGQRGRRPGETIDADASKPTGILHLGDFSGSCPPFDL